MNRTREISGVLRLRVLGALPTEALATAAIAQQIGEGRDKTGIVLRRLEDEGFAKANRYGSTTLWKITAAGDSHRSELVVALTAYLRTEVFVTPGHPVAAGAGYDCTCGECEAERAARERESV